MPRYYFRLRSHASTRTERSRELPDLGAALAEAQNAARAMIRQMRAPRDLRGSLDIEDESRQPLARILLADVAHQSS